jgi:hypothetical protein
MVKHIVNGSYVVYGWEEVTISPSLRDTKQYSISKAALYAGDCFIVLAMMCWLDIVSAFTSRSNSLALAHNNTRNYEDHRHWPQLCRTC